MLELEVDAAASDRSGRGNDAAWPSKPGGPRSGTAEIRRGGRAWPSRIAVFLIRLYQLTLSPLLGPHCRFSPSCSQYTLEAIARHGLLRGAVLGAKRLGRCHPFHGGGFDPVP